jgi:hypothetical protein
MEQMKRSELIRALKAVMLGTDKSIPGYDSIVFDGNWLRSYNGNLSVSHPLKTELHCAVRADEFYRILNRMTEDEVTLALSEGKLLASDKKTRLRLLQLPKRNLTKLKRNLSGLKIEQLEWMAVPNGFGEGLSLSLLGTGKEETLGKIAGVAFRGKDIVATDNFRISHYQMESPITDELFRLRERVVENLLRLGVTYDFVAVKNMWFYIKTKDGIIVSAPILPADDYPIDAVLKVFDHMKFDDTTEAYEFPKDLRDSIRRVEIMACESEIDLTTQITLEPAAGGLILRGEKSFGKVEDFVPWDGKLLAPVVASPGFLKKIISVTRQFRLSPIRKSVLFEAQGFRFLMRANIKSSNMEDDGQD